MSPRSLLFSSDRETSHLVGQVLRDLGIEVESCLEIFSAIEKLTTKVFDLVIADMDDGAEATFLLKTCQELNSTQGALSAAIVGANVSAAHPGVALVLNKPLIRDRIKLALAHCEPLTAKLAQSKPAVVAVQPVNKKAPVFTNPVVPKTSVAKSALPKQIGSLPSEPLSKAIEEPSIQTTDFTDPGTEIERDLVPLAESANHKFRGTTHTAALVAKTKNAGYVDEGRRLHARANHAQQGSPFVRFYRPLIMGSLMLGLAYVGVQPARSEALVSSVAVIYTTAVENTQSWLETKKPDETDDAIQEAQIEAPVRRQRTLRLREHAELIRLETIAPKVALPEVAAEKPAEYAVAGAKSAIPSSLKASFQTVSQDPGPAVDAKLAPPSIMSAMQPVQVSEEASRGMVVDKVVPEYPKQALSAGMQGPVVFQGLIDKDGTISDLKLVRGYMALGKAASDAVKLWHFKPYMVNGHPVDAEIYITVDFKTPSENQRPTL